MTGTSVCDTPKEQLDVLTEVAIFRISAIAGFNLTANDKFADTLNEEFLLLINDYGFSELTFDEIITAFRFNAKGTFKYPSGHVVETVKSYSTFFSINYAAKVLENYKAIRLALDSRIKYDVIQAVIIPKY